MRFNLTYSCLDGLLSTPLDFWSYAFSRDGDDQCKDSTRQDNSSRSFTLLLKFSSFAENKRFLALPLDLWSFIFQQDGSDQRKDINRQSDGSGFGMLLLKFSLSVKDRPDLSTHLCLWLSILWQAGSDQRGSWTRQDRVILKNDQWLFHYNTSLHTPTPTPEYHHHSNISYLQVTSHGLPLFCNYR